MTALDTATVEAEWLRDLLMDLPIVKKPVPAILMNCDNQTRAPAIGRAGLWNLCLRRPAPGEGGNKVFGKRSARLLSVCSRRLAFLSTRVLRAFIDARNSE
uniref:Uncharacterized protein n=1 Tax=Oryza sativa subsp. japonica TaxID=39947 RepID=Q6ZFB6_ORYSJ|nr:hypothetical protein [Oryza sativa Japonica Group]